MMQTSIIFFIVVGLVREYSRHRGWSHSGPCQLNDVSDVGLTITMEVDAIESFDALN